MLNTLAALTMQVTRYGFFGINGFFGLIIGLIVFIIVGVILWRILEIVLPKTGLDAGWIQVIKLLLVLLLFIAFLHFFGIY